MSSVEIQKNKCIIKLSNKFYPRELLELGIKDFDKLADFSINEANEITLKCKDETEEIAYEFCDHLLRIRQGGDSWP